MLYLVSVKANFGTIGQQKCRQMLIIMALHSDYSCLLWNVSNASFGFKENICN